MTFKCENDLRKLVRKAFNDKPRWVEPGTGSTIGLPDCWVPIVRDPLDIPTIVHFELKCGALWKGEELRYKVRREQVKEIERMVDDNLPVFLLVAIQLTDNFVMLRPTAETLSGRVRWAGLDLTRVLFGSELKVPFSQSVCREVFLIGQ